MAMWYLAEGQELVFKPVNAERWRKGRRQIGRRRWLDWISGVLPLALAAAVLAAVWAAGGAARPASKVEMLRLAAQLALWLSGYYLVMAVHWAAMGRELVVTSTHLRLRHPRAWLDRLLGWSLPLADMAQRTGWVLGAPGRSHIPDRLAQLALELPLPEGSAWRWFMPRRLVLPAHWAPVRDGRAEPGPWPAQVAQPTALQVFLMRAPPFDAAAAHDLQRRLEQLPLVQALRGQGTHLPSLGEAGHFPSRLVAAGQLDLAQVPTLRRGLFALGGLCVAGLLALVWNDRWCFFATPWALYLGAGVACAVPCTGLLWPRDLAPQIGVDAVQARRQAGAASMFVGALCGALLAWLLSNALLWGTAHVQTLRTVAFELDKSRIDPGPILLRPVEAEGVPAIEIDTGVRFWRRQPEGARFALQVVRVPLGGWWVYDDSPIVEAMRRD